VRATSLSTVIAWRILYTTLLARIDGDLSCEVALQPVEWLALYWSRASHHPPTESDSILGPDGAVDRHLGGYLNRRNDPAPG
jgi:hypothetical protein